MEEKTILQTLDAEVMQDIESRLVSRRAAIKRGAAGLAIASMPMALATFSKQAFGQGTALPQNIVDILNFALTLEELEFCFYDLGLFAPGLIPAQDRPIFEQIRKHELAHVNLLRSVLGAAAIPKPKVDYTGGNGSGSGPFADVFRNYETYKALSQAFEDTGVRAYKGQAPNLTSNKAILQTALQIHSVEARHASEVRRLRGNFGDTEPHEGWITLAMTDVSGTEPVYAGEDNTVQGGVDVTVVTSVAAKEISEAFDEPLTKEQVLAIVDPFLV